MRRFPLFSIFIINALLLSSCGSTNTQLNVDEPLAPPLDLAPASPTQALSTPEATEAAAATDECLKCHTDKDRLIETADAVEPIAEGESKGVG
jgi:hypothetical protein